MNGQWSHDLYNGGGGGGANNGTGSNFRRNALTGGASGPAKLIISNLDFGVNNSDIEVYIPLSISSSLITSF